jgi:CheY-like chemotaxis protein/PAS domain-containing protein
LADKPKILFLGDQSDRDRALIDRLRETHEIAELESLAGALNRVDSNGYDGLFLASGRCEEALRLERLSQSERILKGMPDGVVLLNSDNTISWGNDRIIKWSGRDSVRGANFYSALGSPEILGPDFCPFHTALTTGRASVSTLRAAESQYFQVHAAPVYENGESPTKLIVTVRDITQEMLQQQKLQAIHRAGIELADLTAEEVFQMEVAERRELLKSNILHYTKDLLKFDVMEIRLLEQQTGELVSLLCVGIDDEAANRPLFAQPQNYGVTGFVAATGKSYLCEDTEEDPLYLQGFKGAKSSMTVPLILHDVVIGTFNVESPEPRAFSESDLQFLEIFSRDVAAALNTLELLAAQQANTAQASVEAIHSAVALPVDEILNDAVNVMERYIGHEPEMVERLQSILRNVRDIKQMIQKVGQKMIPTQAVPTASQLEQRPKLHTQRILVADADEAVRSAAHALLERYGCVVETAHTGDEAVFMVRNCGPHDGYGVIIADIRMPDMNGYDLLMKLRDVIDPVPLVLMTGFGYDPTHTIVNARKAGLPANSVLYKPFRLDQLLTTVESTLEQCGQVPLV